MGGPDAPSGGRLLCRRYCLERSSRAQRRDKACTEAQGRSAKAEAAVAWLSSHPEVGKAVVLAENLEHLTITQRLLDAAGMGWVRIDGGTARVRRADAVDFFRQDPSVRVLLGTRVLERGIDGLQHAGVLLSLGSSFNPAREAQRIGRLRRPGGTNLEVRHVTFLADTDHERRKWATLTRRASDSEAVLFDAASVGLAAVVPWGTSVPLNEPGVYVVAISDEPDAMLTAAPWTVPPH